MCTVFPLAKYVTIGVCTFHTEERYLLLMYLYHLVCGVIIRGNGEDLTLRVVTLREGRQAAQRKYISIYFVIGRYSEGIEMI